MATVVMPDGHTAPGREAFVALGCVGCHAVGWDPSLPAPISANPGPILDRNLRYLPAGSVATAIMVPSHAVAAGFRDPENGLSPMGDYTDTLTVRQLVDVVAYLRGSEAQGAGSALDGARHL